MSYEVEVGRFFIIPLKRSTDISLTTALETFIRNTYGREDEDLKKHIQDFNGLRKNCVTKPLDKTTTSLNALYQYHDQLLSASHKIPFKEANGVHIAFTWKDALHKGKFLASTPKLSIADGEFERLCVLFNIGALMSQIGSEANLNSDDGLKIAARHFQESAGIFAYIKDHIVSVVGKDTLTSDLSPEVLNAFRCVMLSQAQECFYDKASGDATLQKKPDMLAKIAMQASYLYDDSVKAFGNCEKDDALSAVISQCTAKKELFECRAQYNLAKAANEGKQFGEAIARYRIVEPMLKGLVKSSSDLLTDFNGKQFLSVVTSEKEAAEKDNNFIYHDVVPKTSQLNPIGKAVIAKARTFNPEEHLSAKFVDMFATLVPLTVHNALESYEARRKELVEKEVERLREQNALLNEVMSSLNLPAALEDVSGEEVPSSILEKSKTVISKGGSAPIEKLLRELPDALARNQDILTESVRMLNEEQASDAELREKYGEKWKRKPSSDLNAPLRKEASKYQTIIENAQKADTTVKRKYEDHKEGIALLCLPEQQLNQAIPSANPIAALKDHEIVLQLHHLCEQVNTLKAEREVIGKELKTTQCDMTGKFTKTLAEDGALYEDQISPAELDKIYLPLIEQVDDSISRQEPLLANVQRANEKFSELKEQGAGTDMREDVLKRVAASFDRFEELLSHLQEGNKFYSDLTDLLLNLQGKCSDLIFARKTEKEELLKELDKGSVSSAPPPTSPKPRKQVLPVTEKHPPARPPPPKTQEAPASSAQSPEGATSQQPPKPKPRRSISSVAQSASASIPSAPASIPSAPVSTPSAPVSTPSAPISTPTAPVSTPTAPVSASSAPTSQASPSPYPYQRPPYGYGAPPPHGYIPQPGGYVVPPGPSPYPTQAPYAGYPTQPLGTTPPSGGSYPRQGYPAYPIQPQQPGYPGYPQQGYGPYGQQPPFYYPPQQ